MRYLREIQIQTSQRNKVHRAIAKYLTRDLKSGSYILDVGAGRMDFINNVSNRMQRFAIDMDEESRSFSDKGVRLIIGDWRLLSSFDSDFFDLVYASNFLEHLNIDDAKAFLLEVKRILKCDGQLVLIQPNWQHSYRYYFDDITHKSIFSHVSLKTLLNMSGFKILSLYRRFLPYSFESRLRIFSFLAPLYLRLPLKFLPGQMLIKSIPNKSNL